VSTHPAPPLDADTLLDYEGARAAVESAIKSSRYKLREVADAVAALPHREGGPPTVSSISGAKTKTGSSVYALQLDVLRALTGARFAGPLYRVRKKREDGDDAA